MGPANARDAAQVDGTRDVGAPASHPLPELHVPTPCHPRRYAWAEIMERVFAVDVLECARCKSRLRIIAALHPPEATRAILKYLGLPTRPPPILPAAPEAEPEWLDA